MKRRFPLSFSLLMDSPEDREHDRLSSASMNKGAFLSRPGGGEGRRRLKKKLWKVFSIISRERDPHFSYAPLQPRTSISLIDKDRPRRRSKVHPDPRRRTPIFWKEESIMLRRRKEYCLSFSHNLSVSHNIHSSRVVLSLFLVH